jgi:hypothetical protein
VGGEVLLYGEIVWVTAEAVEKNDWVSRIPDDPNDVVIIIY